MSPELKEFEAKALQLEPKDQATLAEHLIASLDERQPSENERLWLGEADRRYLEYKKGTISARTADAAKYYELQAPGLGSDFRVRTEGEHMGSPLQTHVSARLR